MKFFFITVELQVLVVSHKNKQAETVGSLLMERGDGM